MNALLIEEICSLKEDRSFCFKDRGNFIYLFILRVFCIYSPQTREKNVGSKEKINYTCKILSNQKIKEFDLLFVYLINYYLQVMMSTYLSIN